MANCGHCKNCQYFTPSSDTPKIGACALIQDSNDMFITERDNYVGVVTWDYESYRSGADVHRDFGCVLFKRRTAKPKT